MIQNYCRSSEHVVGAERVKFLSTVKNQQDSDDNFISRLREAARYANAKDEMIRKKIYLETNISTLYCQVTWTSSVKTHKSH